jgi:hypothetical protein
VKKVSAMMVVILLMRGETFAQTSTPFKIDGGKFSEEYIEAGESSINSKTMDNFGEMFAGATNVLWTKDKHNIDRVYFQTKGKVTLAGFNTKGHFLFSITSYQEELLPKEILLLVKKNYYGKHIFGITEVNTMNKTAYLIMLDKAPSWLHIKVLDDELTEETVLLKAN